MFVLLVYPWLLSINKIVADSFLTQQINTDIHTAPKAGDANVRIPKLIWLVEVDPHNPRVSVVDSDLGRNEVVEGNWIS